MGFTLSYVATKVAPERVINDLSLALEETDMDRGGATLTLTQYREPTWSVLQSRDPGYVGAHAEALAALSVDGPVIGFDVVETANANGARYWENGHLVWSVTYEFERNPRFVIEGTPQTLFQELRAQYAKGLTYNAQEERWEPSEFPATECDHEFSTLDHLAEELTGYAYDGVYGADEVIRVWASAETRTKGLLGRLFGVR
ncbi:MAG: hypothetical protein AAFS07_12970 [Pseudomonadota bacterium]